MTDKSALRGFLLLLMTTITLIALTGFQVTSETAGTRLLGRLGVVLIEIDRWLPVHQEGLKLLARDRPEGELEVADLPVQVAIPSMLVLDADEVLLRSLISDAVGTSLYKNGTDGFATGEGQAGSLDLNEPIRWVVSLLNSGTHGFWQVVLPFTALLLALTLAAVLTSGGAPLPAIAFGAAAAAGISLIGWLLMELGNSSSDRALNRETFLILRDGFWIGVRNGVAVAVAAGALHFMVRSLSPAHVQQFDYEPALEVPEEPFN